MSENRLVSQIAGIPPLQEFREPTVKTPDTLKPIRFSPRQKLIDILNTPGKKEYRRRGRSGRGLSHRSVGRCSQCAGIGSEKSSFCSHRLFPAFIFQSTLIKSSLAVKTF